MTHLTSYCQVCSSPAEIHDFLISSHTHLVIFPGWPLGVSVPCIPFTQKPTYLTPPTNITVLVRTPWTSIQVAVSFHQTHTGIHNHTFPITASRHIPPNKDLTTTNTMIYALFLSLFFVPLVKIYKGKPLHFYINFQVYNTF